MQHNAGVIRGVAVDEMGSDPPNVDRGHQARRDGEDICGPITHGRGI